MTAAALRTHRYSLAPRGSRQLLASISSCSSTLLLTCDTTSRPKWCWLDARRRTPTG